MQIHAKEKAGIWIRLAYSRQVPLEKLPRNCRPVVPGPCKCIDVKCAVRIAPSHSPRKYCCRLADPLTLRGSEYAHSVLELNKAIERAEGLLTG
jgi:hypothetical protein